MIVETKFLSGEKIMNTGCDHYAVGLSAGSQHPISHVVQAARPVIFADTIGMFQAPLGPSTRKVAVLFLSPWGFEEIAMRKMWRMLAEQFSLKGIPSFRFDYPGTGDALDKNAETNDLELWVDRACEACELLRKLSGVRHIIIVGQGLGAALAYKTSLRMPGIAGVALLAPVISGHAYAREVLVLSRMTEGKAAATSDLPMLGGEAVAPTLFASIKGVDLNRSPVPPVQHYFLAARYDRPAQFKFNQHLFEKGKDVEAHPYEGFDEMLNNLTLSKPPLVVMEKLVKWVESIEKTFTNEVVSQPREAVLTPLNGVLFREKPVRFGDNNRLFGIVCEPGNGQRQKVSVLLLNTSYERAAGWGRSMTALARDLAAVGIASFRYDAANVGDSPALPGAPEQVIYSETQLDDVDAAVAFMETLELGRIILAGRCSGGYTAFRSLLRNEQLAGAVIANAHVLRWDPRQSLEDLLLFVPKPLNAYKYKAFSIKSWKKILTGRVNLKRGVLNILGLLKMRCLGILRPILEKLSMLSNAHKVIHRDMKKVCDRGARLSFIFSDGDIGLNYFYQHFDVDSERLRLYPAVKFQIVKDADHNLLTPRARAVFQSEIERLVREAG
ncbi:alpha/beta hydrolase [Rhizobium sp. rho-1.1]|uniref:serine aminopeptidase domain-containing protein n=1 Tax=Rhizobium sp. rho-1.1 TaxID=2506429 RepID=UPI001160362A|nr:alpha/beta hydrolase [Rhizobium sp. rho-1.1]TQX84070.1 hypothetical protein EQW76_26560 [Rhizobium sp. rho-13.1]TQY06734.1 hypothetical protein EQW74_25920 [Rhizobium sp. rho-1.1]